MSETPARKKLEATPVGSVARPGRRLARYVMGFVTIVLVIDAIVGDKGLISRLQARRNFAVIEQSLLRARRDNVALRDEARRLREDPAAIEEFARRELGLIRPGEKLFIIKDAPPKPNK
ncbi:MAG: septum formation initiator family protein [Acidobacteria bacterium]|nr:septum formation initiator family protein [Acidobacteriota bacterium]